jgi:hypothetical protein
MPATPPSEVLSFHGTDRDAAWDEAIRLAEIIEAKKAARHLSIRAEKRKGEWIVALYHNDPERHP